MPLGTTQRRCRPRKTSQGTSLSGKASRSCLEVAGARAVNLAAHSHIIEFGLLAMLLSFVQPFVFLSEKWKRRWVKVLLGGSVILPVFVMLELKLGLLAGGIADVGGLMVLVSLIGMLVGILRYSGSLDVREGVASESAL